MQGSGPREEAGAGRDGRAGVNMERAASDGSTPASIAAHEGHTVRSLDRVEYPFAVG